MTKKNKLLTAILKLVKPCSTSDKVDQYFRYCKEEIQEKQLETVDFETFLNVFLPVIKDKFSVQFLLYKNGNLTVEDGNIVRDRTIHVLLNQFDQDDDISLLYLLRNLEGVHLLMTVKNSNKDWIFAIII